MVRLLRTHAIYLTPEDFVSIPQWCDCCLMEANNAASISKCFNPTMVRLLPTMTTSLTTTCKFQSHNGAIAAVRNADFSLIFPTFQSHNGAIAARNLFSCFPQTAVSIPQWCDCCGSHLGESSVKLLVSIPQWCDCCRQNRLLIIVFQVMVSIPQWCDCCVS